LKQDEGGHLFPSVLSCSRAFEIAFPLRGVQKSIYLRIEDHLNRTTQKNKYAADQPSRVGIYQLTRSKDFLVLGNFLGSI